MSDNYPDGRYKMTNPRDTTGDGWTIEKIIDGRLRGPMTTVEEWIATGYKFEPVVILTVEEHEELSSTCNCDCSPCGYCRNK